MDHISRKEILESIEDYLQLMNQWAHGPIVNYLFAWDNSIRAETLIELLELHDCGQIGGFDNGQPRSIMGRSLGIEDRYNWLKNKKS